MNKSELRLSDPELMPTTKLDNLVYESIYDMGNPQKMEDCFCDYNCLADEIRRVMDLGELTSKTERSEINIIKLIKGQGGLIARFKETLNIDFALFEKNQSTKTKDEILRYKAEVFKIFYLFYMLENNFTDTKVIKLLGNPSMENISNSFFLEETHNSSIVTRIKGSLERELLANQHHHMPMQRIKDEVFRVTFEWQLFMEKVHEDMIYYRERDNDYDFAKRADAFIICMQQPKRKINKNIYRHSPVETLYLKILQYECLGQIKDNDFANRIVCTNDYFMPQEIIQEIRLLCRNPIAVDGIEEYIKNNAAKIEKYVYINKEPDKENRRRIRKSTDKVLDVLKYCTNVWIDKNNTTELKEIWIISCLQAILIDSPNEIFDYPLYGEQKHSKNKQRVQAILKSNVRAYGALQLYWNRKVGDRWYANVGKLESRKKLREVENTCDATLKKILSCSDIYDMRGTHEHYFSKASRLLLKMSTL